MGDGLAQLLFETLQAQPKPGLPNPPFRPIGWDELDSDSQRAWEAVATKARQEMSKRFVRDMRDATAAFGAEQAIANLLEAEAN